VADMRRYVAFVGNLKNALKILSQDKQGGNIWENPGADSGIILKLILKK